MLERFLLKVGRNARTAIVLIFLSLLFTLSRSPAVAQTQPWMDASLPAGYVSTARSIGLQQISPLKERQGLVHWQMRAERSVRPSVDSGQVISIVMGKTAGRAGSLLTETYGLVQSPDISIRPFWWPWLPFIPIRIAVIS